MILGCNTMKQIGFSKLNEELEQKWGSFLDDSRYGVIQDSYRRACTGVILENCERAYLAEGGGYDNVIVDVDKINKRLKESNQGQRLNEAAPANNAGSYPSNPMAGPELAFMPIVRRAAYKFLSYDMVGVQPMPMAVSLIFAMRSRATAQNGTEILFNESDTRFTANADAAGAGYTNNDPLPQADLDAYKAHPGLSTAAGEALGDGVGDDFSEVAFSIEKLTVTAMTRALKGELTHELIEDFKNGHNGLDARAELTNILIQELLASTNRHVFRTIYNNAKTGCPSGVTTTAGKVDLAVDGSARWFAEAYQALLFFIQRDANQIMFGTRRGRGNFVICSADVASAFVAAKLIDPQSSLNSVDPDGMTDNCYVGTVAMGKMKVFIDPYVTAKNFYVVGYKGESNWDAGVYLCPYVPLQRLETTGEKTFAPKIAYKTRYGLVSNPFANAAGTGALTWNANEYFRKVEVVNL